MKVAYIGYDSFFYCLEEIVKAGHEIVSIYSFPTDNLYEYNEQLEDYASVHHLPFTIDKITYDDLCRLVDNGVEILFSAGYIYKIPQHEKLYEINFHPSPLPVGKGPWPWPCAILQGRDSYGVSLHKIVDALDSGDLLGQELFGLDPNETLLSIEQKIEMHGRQLVSRIFQNAKDYYTHATPQPSAGEYWREPSTEERTLYYDDSKEKIDSVLRAFYGYESFFVNRDEQVTQLTKAHFSTQKPENTLHYFPVENGYIVNEN